MKKCKIGKTGHVDNFIGPFKGSIMKLLMLFPAILAFTNSYAADTYKLSADGLAVVRLTPEQPTAAGSLNTSVLPQDYTYTNGTGGNLTVTDYTAGFRSGIGGAQFQALYDNGTPLAAGQNLEWIQVITTNSPLGGATSPYPDNAANPGAPFYSLTAANTRPGLAPNTLNFYDFSKRDPSTLTATNAITWNASLYPVIQDGKNITVKSGLTWGWTMKKAPVGSDSGTFANPQPGSAVVSGVGTNGFSWGVGDPSSLLFTGGDFDTRPGTPFKLGTIRFHNGTIASGTEATGVDLNIAMNFTNIPELNSVFKEHIALNNTPNTDDPFASADTITVDGHTFSVFEGADASVDLMAMLSTGLQALPTGATPSGAALYSEDPFDPSGLFHLSIVGFANPTSGGFIPGTTVPEPSTLFLTFGALLGLFIQRKKYS
jgi:hypothetical protein